ncbi:uncharacterized protein [Miscanthus floridulus]|uniref:uncharacterized protein n=1 Tax=Miscanthus floridulus TaxID=154761 RepID=UPI0034584BCB
MTPAPSSMGCFGRILPSARLAATLVSPPSPAATRPLLLFPRAKAAGRRADLAARGQAQGIMASAATTSGGAAAMSRRGRPAPHAPVCSAPPPPAAREARHGAPLPRGLLLPSSLSAVTAGCGACRSGDTCRCKARDAGRGRDNLQCRYRVTGEHGVQCKLLSPHAALQSHTYINYDSFNIIVAAANFLYSLGMLLEFAAFFWLCVKQPGLTRPFRVPARLLAAVVLCLVPSAFLVFVMAIAGRKVYAISAAFTAACAGNRWMVKLTLVCGYLLVGSARILFTLRS